MRKIVECEQGDSVWHAHRNTPGMINGSELAAIMGLSSYLSRSELLRRKATGIEPEYDAATLKRFADGHKHEALARPLAEEIIGDDLSPLVMADEIDSVNISVSLDGITFGNAATFEHKSLNMMLADALDAGVIPDEYHPQMEAGLMVSGATRCLFMASRDGDKETARHCWYESNPELRKRMIAACKQFAIDLENYVPEPVTVAPVAATIEALPTLMIKVEGKVLATNLDQFKASAQAFIANINTDLQTDQHFADADKIVKFLKDGEERLALCKSQALAQTASIDELFRTIDTISGQMKDKRLALDKLVKAEKENRRAEIITKAQIQITEHIIKLNERIGGQWMPVAKFTPFAEAVKGLKSLDSMRDKISAALVNAKIEANEIADRIERNAKYIKSLDTPYDLAPDFAAICTKEEIDFVNLIASRATAIKEAEAKKAEAAKKAEEARIAAAVEAERRAGEARAAAVIDAERKAEAKRVADAAKQASAVCEQQTGNQRGKADAGVGLPLGDRAQPDTASIPPITASGILQGGDVKDADKFVQFVQEPQGEIIQDTAMITEYIALQACSPGEKKAMRATIDKWEAYRVKMVAARGLAVAA